MREAKESITRQQMEVLRIEEQQRLEAEAEKDEENWPLAREHSFTIKEHKEPKTKDQESQTEVIEKPLECPHYFHGYKGLKDDAKKLKAIAGVSVEVFQMMLHYLKGYQSRSMTVEDQLLILLMKLKMGISFSAISVIFGLQLTTVQGIFTTLLSVLSHNTNHLIRYPSREQVKASMPASFLEDCPDTRIIIDCTEFFTQVEIYLFLLYIIAIILIS